MNMRKKKLLSTLLLSLSAGVASAQQEQGLTCHFGYEDQFLPIPTETASENESPVDVKANRVQLLQNGTSVFSGNVDILRDNQLLSAERATYNRNSGDVRASGNVSVRDSEMVIESEQAEWSVANDQGQMLNAQYHVRQMHARGEAAHILRKGQKNYRS
jgi:LPS-assembly protein